MFPTSQTLARFYSGRGNQLVWCDATGKVLPAGRLVLDTLHKAGDEGLEPKIYAVQRLDLLAGEIGREAASADAAAARLVNFDLLLTAAFLRYASDVSTGRVHPDEVLPDWHIKPGERDLVADLEDALRTNRLPQMIASLPPPHEGYARLRTALAALRGQQPGQGTNAADPDLDHRIQLVELNLDRWRWIPRQLGDPAVLINISGFSLDVLQGGSPVWHTRIVVGQSYTPTPVFNDRIVALVVNPPWNVPTSIAVAEYFPVLQRNPRALDKKSFRLVEGAEGSERTVDPARVKWSEIDPEHLPFRLRQDPGPDNALGRLKFDLTNDFHIYLHDTPAAELFGKRQRNLSHGCIRVENALELAQRLLGATGQDKAQAALAEALGQKDQRRIGLDPAVPVHIIYCTAWVDAAGTLQFGPDVYGFDSPQRAALDKIAPA